ncbi:hypothetical protein [Actinoplanes sp. NPDC049265]|uniref:hypothetical protein n=1 Tax=Actinoplanes sp. NPDC049265 TaxID=3363902 RepID=UPI0037126064
MRVRLHLRVLLMTAAGVVSLMVAAPAAARSGMAPAGTIPGSAMLQPADLAGAVPVPADQDLWPWLRPPAPHAYLSRVGVRTAERAVRVVYPVAETQPTVLLEYVAVYRGMGAERYLWRLRGAVSRPHARCAADGRTWRLAATGVAGRDSLLLSVSQTVQYPDGTGRVQTAYVAVARVGHALVVVADVGWEYGDGHRSLTRRLAPVAVRRAAQLR